MKHERWSLGMVIVVASGCGGITGGDDGDDDPSIPCKCEAEPVPLELGAYVQQDFTAMERAGEPCFEGDLCPIAADVAADDVKVRFTRDGKTYEAVFKVTSKETR